MDQKSKICILGYGTEGKATLDYLVKHGYGNLTVCDRNIDLQDILPQGVSCRLGEHYMEDLTDFDVIFRTPGIRYLDPHIQSAILKGAEVTSAMKYFLKIRNCKVVGVTGTKGKGTTSTLIFEMLKKKYKSAYLAGNIGSSPLEFVDELTPDSVVVLEMSSFQLQDLNLSPDIAVFLNTTSDHLDYHADNFEYLAAKENILAHQDEDGILVINKDYEYSKYYKPLAKGKILEVSRKDRVENGATVHKGNIVFMKDGEETEICPVKEMKLIGSHNIENVLPATSVAMTLGVSVSDVAEVIRSFSGLPHRLELVRELKGIRFFNDSFSTTPETSMAAVDSFDEDTVLIAGGWEKGLNYEDWAVKILTKPNLTCVILIGDIAAKMESALIEAEKKLGDAIGSPTKILTRKTLEEAVIDGFAQVKKPGVVVMSPATASFGLFKDYKERGQKFRDIVNALH
ncbi:MAG: UDP-N-acetylmuramoyl-L-alanine--D-glutamate ligase [Candidatus Gracilibacteria bacterium]|jgi:UDP-N-acetylmuramoylalanine--D-glutamate ligase|nr:UDP-N-acetylmuramoyl-L-alanine--D-glutamate ligase [Candidatus Gracilibacteria bacterium]